MDAEKIDRHLDFLRAEHKRLGEINARWAEGKARQYQQLIDDMVALRRRVQMTGMSGRTIE